MRLLQVCNVGDICGGTAACAWSVTRALPMCQHSVLFLTPPTPETRHAFRHCQLQNVRVVDQAAIQSLEPDLCLLHNTSPGHFPQALTVPAVLYRHSVGNRISAPLEVACSQWLSNQLPGNVPVLYQGVPIPPYPSSGETRSLRERLLVGRLCTPTRRKWPSQLFDFYKNLAAQVPAVDWEFIGCPPAMQRRLSECVQHRARFLPAGWTARSHLWRWDILLYHHPLLTESFGRTVAEAMRAGCIAVVDNKGGFVEQVSPETGFPCRTPLEFRHALELLQDRALREALSAKARRVAEERFSLAAFSLRLRNVFQMAADRQ